MIGRRIAADDPAEKFDLLAGSPKLGPVRDDIAPGLRYLPVGSYLILYLIIDDGVETVRVVHASRRLSEALE